MERRLGRGLGSLLGQTEADRQAATPQPAPQPAAAAAPAAGAAPGSGTAGAVDLPLKSIRPHPGQPRKVFDSVHLEELKDSIEVHGILQPILVRPHAGGGYEIISGERRWRAARLAGLAVIPAVIRDVDDRASLELAIVENVQRRDLDPIEKAKGFQALIVEFGLTHEAIATRVAVQRSTIANFVRLLDLPQEVQDGVSAGLLSMGHAKALLGLKDQEAAKRALAQVVRDELSVRETERLVQAAAAPVPSPAAAPAVAKPTRETWQGTLETRMREHLGAKVELQKGKGYRGRIVVHFNGRDDLERLSELLGPKDLL